MVMLLRRWILFCAGLVALGWLLSLFNALVPIAYEIAIGLFVIGCFRHGSKPVGLIPRRKLLLHRLRSKGLLLPGIFVVSAFLLLIKGILTPPFHDDGLCYRIPRAMHWIMDQHWHWLNAQDARLDVLGTVSEWLTVPILLIFHTDRLVFLPNWICHLFLPGLIFSVWRKFGVSPKIAWLSMWLLPSGFCFALQAVNTSNDSLGAFFVIAALFFAFKGLESGEWCDYAFSILSIALATGVKLNLFSLGLAWVVAIIGGWKTLKSRPVSTIGVALLALLISFAPTAYFNLSHTPSWTGLAYVQSVPPGVNFICTSFNLITQNLIPPFLAPLHTDPVVIPGIEGTTLGDLMERYFYHPPLFYSQVAIQQAGVGFIVIICFCVLFVATRAQSNSRRLTGFFSRPILVLACIGLAFVHYLLFISSDQPARLVCVYYLLLLPALFVGRTLKNPDSWRFYKLVIAAAMLAGLYLSLFATENPLGDSSPFSERMFTEELAMAKAREVIPNDETSVGIIRFFNQRETWLWKPYGSRRVYELPLRPDLAQLQRLGIRYLALSNEMLVLNHMNIESWTKNGSYVEVGSLILGRDNSWYFVKVTK